LTFGTIFIDTLLREYFMKIAYRVSEKYAAVFSKHNIIAEVIGVAIILGGIVAHIIYH